VGVLADRMSLEMMPVCLVVMCGGLLALYPLAVRVGAEAKG
jgi:hypothetical protein